MRRRRWLKNTSWWSPKNFNNSFNITKDKLYCTKVVLVLNKAGRVAAKEHIIVNNPKVLDAQTREMFQERRQLTKRLRDIPSVLTADLADVESEESAMTEEIVENLLKRKARVRFFTLHPKDLSFPPRHFVS